VDKVETITGLVKAFSALCELWEIDEKDVVVAARVFCFLAEECARVPIDKDVLGRIAHRMIVDAYR